MISMSWDSEKLPFDSWTDSGKVRPAAQISHRGILQRRALVSVRLGFSPTTACCAVEPRFIKTRCLGRDTFLNSCINWCNSAWLLKTEIESRQDAQGTDSLIPARHSLSSNSLVFFLGMALFQRNRRHYSRPGLAGRELDVSRDNRRLRIGIWLRLNFRVADDPGVCSAATRVA